MRNRLWKNWLLRISALGLAAGMQSPMSVADDLRDAAPPGAFMAVYGKHNPERDYQKEHFKAVWEEVQKAKLHEKILQLIQSNMSEGDAEKFVAARDA
jgi:hypothetical protein